jgi:hypothetical protein
VRALVVVFAATLNATLPVPVAEAPAVMLIHGALVVAVHAHVAADAVTAIVPVPPASAKFCVDGEIENVHAGGGAAAWLIVNALPATVMVALLAAPVFAATL